MSSTPNNFSKALEELESTSKSTAQSLKDRLQVELKDLESKISELKPQLEELKSKVQDGATKAKDKVENRVKENPWASIGIVGLIFFVLGFLLAGTTSRKND